MRYWEVELYNPNLGGYYWDYSYITYYITVVQPLSSFGISSNLSVYENHTKALQVNRKPATSEASITYQSSNTAIATVSAQGVVTGVKAGNCVITAASSGCAKSVCAVTVKPNPLVIASVTPSGTEIIAHDQLKWDTAVQYGSGAKRYSYYIYRDQKLVKKTSFSASPSYTYVPVYGGTYYACCYVKDSLTTVKMDSAATTVYVRPLEVGTAEISAPVPCVNQPLFVSAAAIYGEGDYQFSCSIYCDDIPVYKSPYQSSSRFSYTPKAEGSYYATCEVISNGETVTMATDAITIGAKLTATVSAEKTAYANASIEWDVATQGGYGTVSIAYEVYLGNKKVASAGYKIGEAGFTYKAKEIGAYRLLAKVKDASGTVTVTSSKTTVTAEPITAYVVCTQSNSPYVGYKQRWIASYEGGYGQLQFKYEVYLSGKCVYPGQYGTKTYVDYTPLKAGVYTVKVYIKDQYSSAIRSDDYIIYTTDPALSSVTAANTNVALETPITWTATGTGVGTPSYSFCVYLDGAEVHRENTGTTACISYKPYYTGTYTVTCKLTIGSKTATLSSDAVEVTYDGFAIKTNYTAHPDNGTVGDTLPFVLNCLGTTDKGALNVFVTLNGSNYGNFTFERRFSGAVVLVNASTAGTYCVTYQYVYNTNLLVIGGGKCVVTASLESVGDVNVLPDANSATLTPAEIVAPALAPELSDTVIPSQTPAPADTVSPTATDTPAPTEPAKATDEPATTQAPADLPAPTQTNTDVMAAEVTAPVITPVREVTNAPASTPTLTPITTPTPTPTPTFTPVPAPPEPQNLAT